MTTTPTLTLADFVLARVSEDEAVARAVNTGQWYPWDERNGDLYLRDLNSKAAEHMARHDPARVMRECAAKRVAVDWYLNDDGTVMVATIRAMAEVYSDHPDFRDEWRA